MQVLPNVYPGVWITLELTKHDFVYWHTLCKIFSYILKWGTWVSLRYMDGCAWFVYWLKFWAKKGSGFSRSDTRSKRWVFFKVMQRSMLNRQTGAMQNSVLWPQYKPGYFEVSIWTVWAGESLCASFGSVSELIEEDCSAVLLLTEGRSMKYHGSWEELLQFHICVSYCHITRQFLTD